MAPIGQKSVTEIFIEEKEKLTNKEIEKQYEAVFVTQYNSSLSSFVLNFRILTQDVAEESLTEKKCPYVLYKSDRRKIKKIEKRRQNED